MDDKSNDTTQSRGRPKLTREERQKRKLAREQRRREQLRRTPLELRLTCSVEDLRLATGWGPDKIYDLINDGKLESTKVDRRRMIIVKSVLRLLGIEPPTAPAPVPENIRQLRDRKPTLQPAA